MKKLFFIFCLILLCFSNLNRRARRDFIRSLKHRGGYGRRSVCARRCTAIGGYNCGKYFFDCCQKESDCDKGWFSNTCKANTKKEYKVDDGGIVKCY